MTVFAKPGICERYSVLEKQKNTQFWKNHNLRWLLLAQNICLMPFFNLLIINAIEINNMITIRTTICYISTPNHQHTDKKRDKCHDLPATYTKAGDLHLVVINKTILRLYYITTRFYKCRSNSFLEVQFWTHFRNINIFRDTEIAQFA